jgi:dTDP-4-dehydrorhamnose reductase
VKVWVTGSGGQLGKALLCCRPPDLDVVGLGRDALDITDEASVRERFIAERPDVIVNTAAYTAVDRAEDEPDAAMAVNAGGPANLARQAAETGCRLVQVSTDFVFDGERPLPYPPDAETAPLGAYGRSKLEGERLALGILGASATVVRTAWLYSSRGNNFVNTMLRLMSERDRIAVVADQVGTPTWTLGLARAIWAIVGRPSVSGIHHWTDLGVASWYDFAVAINEEAVAAGRLASPAQVIPITTAEYPTDARRPAFSVLDTRQTRDLLGLPGEHWRFRLRRMLGGEADA